jgi:superoxide dismutase
MGAPFLLTRTDGSRTSVRRSYDHARRGRPVLVLDLYEHASHMDSGSAAARYAEIYMEAIRWENAARLHEQYARQT